MPSKAIIVELWELIGGHWRLPIRVVWNDDVGDVRIGAGLRLLECQWDAADKTLERILLRRFGNTFTVTRSELSTCAVPSKHSNPEAIVEWIPNRPSTLGVEHERESGAPEFIEKYCESGYSVISDPVVATVVWASLQKWMLHWLLNEQKPVDIMFAKLVPLCLRRNWCAAAAKAEHMQMQRSNKGKRKKKHNEKTFLSPKISEMIDRGVADFLVGQYATGYDEKHKICPYLIEVVPNERWIKSVLTVENSKKSTGRYMDRVNHQMRKQLPDALEIYSQYLQEANFPGAAIGYFHQSGVRWKRKFIHGSYAGVEASGPWQFNDPSLIRMADGTALPVEAKAEIVPTLPRVRPPKQNVRKEPKPPKAVVPKPPKPQKPAKLVKIPKPPKGYVPKVSQKRHRDYGHESTGGGGVQASERLRRFFLDRLDRRAGKQKAVGMPVLDAVEGKV